MRPLAAFRGISLFAFRTRFSGPRGSKFRRESGEAYWRLEKSAGKQKTILFSTRSCIIRTFSSEKSDFPRFLVNFGMSDHSEISLIC